MSASSAPTLLRLCESPLLLAQSDVLSPTEIAALRTWVADEAALEAAGCVWSRESSGTSTHLTASMHPLLAALQARLEAVLGLTDALADEALGATFRLRKYAVGQGHPPHLDTYTIAGQQLVATALVCLEAPEVGGQTVFLDATDGPVHLTHQPGQLLAWHNVRPDGSEVASSSHLGAPVVAGHKQVLALFFYGPPSALLQSNRGHSAPLADRHAIRALPQTQRVGALRGFGRVLAIVDDGVPRETVELIEQACHARGIRPVHVNPRSFDFGIDRRLRDGDMIYRPAVSLHATRVEQHLWQPRVGSFYLDPDGPMFVNLNAQETFVRAGLSVPRAYWLDKPSRSLLRQMVDDCGGLPVVVKASGYSRGIGVMRADSLPSLFSIVDFAGAEGTKPLLTSYIPDAVHWRVVVVGDRAVASYRNVTDDDDFRTSGSDDAEDYAAPLPAGAAQLAVDACRVLRHAHGGVDILEHASGRLYLLEANFPCYYAQAQLSGGVDVAGAMVQYLLERAEALAPPSGEPLGIV